MTTGATGSLCPDLTALGDGYRYYDRKIWSGTNGRYNLPLRTKKFNSYSMSEVRTVQQFSPKRYCTNGPANLLNKWTNNDTLALQAKLLDKVKQHSFNAGVAMAEFEKTLELCSETVLRFARAIKCIRKGDIPGAAANLGARPRGNHSKRQRPSYSQTDTAKVWLELQYGWKPLLSDIEEAAKAAAVLANKPRKHTFRVSKTLDGLTSESIGQYGYEWAMFSHKVEKSSIVYELTEDMSAPRSLGLMDPASVAWELLPFSFVVDWFIPIGSYLNNINQVPALKGRFCVTDSQWTHTTSYGLPPKAGTLRGNYTGASCLQDYFVVTRTTPSSLIVPPPNFKPWVKSLSSLHLANALALLHVLTK